MTASATDEFPFPRALSLHKLLEKWREAAENSADPAFRRMAEDLVARAAEVPELTSCVHGAADVQPHAALIEQLMSIVVPPAHSTDWLVGGMTPFKMEAFFATPQFRDLFRRTIERSGTAGIIEGFDDPEAFERMKLLDAFQVIAQHFYGVDTGCSVPAVFRGVDEAGLNHYYRIHVDTRFIEINLIGEKPVVSDEQFQTLIANPLDFDLGASLLPPDRFEFRGFTLVTLLEVTEHEVHSRLKNDLLQKDALTSPSRLDSIERHLRDLLRIPDLRIGVIGLATGQFDDFEDSQTFGRSLLMESNRIPTCPRRNESSYAELFATGEPVVVSHLDDCCFCTSYENRIREQNFHGLLLAPLKDGDRVNGVLELATGEAGRLTAFSVIQLMNVISLFSAAMMRSLDERHDQLQALIKKEFTSIHPAVEWRFQKAARNLERKALLGEKAESEEIVFEDVYPLYGLSDIRDSSILRNHAIREDLTEQLGLALSVIVEASSHEPLPALDELGFRLVRFVEGMEDGLTSDAEVGALEFLRNDVEPLFDRLASLNARTRAKVEAYRAAIDERHGVLYQRRKEYEQAVAAVNETVSGFLQRRQSEAQVMFPHYFEKFETDGVDYNIYLGGAMAPDRHFDSLFLRNLRLWQLQTMCGVVWELERNHHKLPVSLDVAHLILVQDFPIAIRFSKDEKRFGVDGAYNARYMIVKKRIDKAFVKGTTQRITQPGMIAIVYSQERERKEYYRFLDYLAAAGYIEPAVEDLEVEDLQGISGLRLLRVKVAESPPEMEVRTRPDLATQLSLSAKGDAEQAGA